MMASSPSHPQYTLAEPLAHVLEQHATERRVWSSWGQTLRAEATSLDGDLHSGPSFTREFLRSSALQNMFASVFDSPMGDEDKNNLLFIMKICLLNSRASTSTTRGKAADATNAAEMATGARPSLSTEFDFVEQMCARFVKLGEEFIRVANHRYDGWFRNRCTLRGEGTQDDEKMMMRVDSTLSTAADFCRDAVATALASIKVQHREGSTSEPQWGDSPNMQAASSRTVGDDAIDATRGSSMADSAMLHAPSSYNIEPLCTDYFDASCAPGTFCLRNGSCGDAESDVPTTTTRTITAASSTGSSCGMFPPAVPALEPSHLLEHDAWASHLFSRAMSKTKEVSRELSNFSHNQRFDETVRSSIEDQVAVPTEIVPQLEELYGEIDTYACQLERDRAARCQERDVAAEALQAEVQTELENQVALRERLEQLEEQARKVREELESSTAVIARHRQEIVDLDETCAQYTRAVDRRAQDIFSARHEVQEQLRLTRLVKLFLNGLSKKSAEQTVSNLKAQEEVLVQQFRFAVAQSEDAVRRMGVVVSMLETSRLLIKERCSSSLHGSSDPPNSMSDCGASTGSGSAAPPVRALSNLAEDAGRVLLSRAGHVKCLVQHLTDLQSKLSDAIEMEVDPLLSLHAMCDAIDMAATDLSTQHPSLMPMSQRATDASFAMSRVMTAETVADCVTTTTALDSTCNATKRKSGLPAMFRKRARNKATDVSDASHDDLFTLPVRNAVSEMERLLQQYAWRVHAVDGCTLAS